MIKILCMAIVIFSFLTGCAERIGERRGTQIDVVPVTYSIALKVNPKKESLAQVELDSFIQENWNLIVNQQVELVWRTKLGKRWALKTRKDLLSRGIYDDYISITQEKAGFSERFDFEFKTKVHKSVVSICDYAGIGKYGKPTDGCYTENARWQSMVNPENMLNQSLQAENVNK